jgi:hypothetical protein
MLDPEDMRMPGWRGGDGNAAYLDKTLRHHAIELGFDESVGWRSLAALFLRAFFASLIVFAVFGFFLLFSWVAGEELAVALFLLGQLAAGAVFWVVLLASRLPEPIAEWRVLLADRRDTADSVYIQIAGALRQRRIPIHAEYRRIHTGLGVHEVSNRLVLKDGVYDAYVSVFGYGTSLYLGWTMWRSRRGYQLIARFVVDVITGIVGRNSPEHQMMRTERPRAMREAVHAVCREGLFVGIEQRQVPLSFGFPQGMPPVESGQPMPDAPPPSSLPWTGDRPHPPPNDPGTQPGQAPLSPQ